MKSKVLIRLNAMGDILLTLPLINRLNSKGFRVFLIIHNRWKSLAPLFPARVLFYKGPAELLKLVKRIKNINPVQIHDLQQKAVSIFIKLTAGIPYTTYKKRPFKEQIKALLNKFPLNEGFNIPVWQRYAKSANLEILNPNPYLNLTSDYLNECESILNKFNLKAKSFILLHADASKPGKVMPLLLTKAVYKTLNLPVYIIGTGNTALEHVKPERDLRNKIDLYHLAGIMHFSAGVISTDSGPMHLARAAGAKVVALFFQTDPCLGFGPIMGENVKIISKRLPCKPCSLHGQRVIRPLGTYECKRLDFYKTAEEINDFLVESRK